ncbi:MAG: hypothetical protein DMD84_10090 [Candidatus Rokuibacteriota bacterium]|nr:MAG: hypothetical protein DMD84_10090 [Candidatus Rokubacteria bacterium]
MRIPSPVRPYLADILRGRVATDHVEPELFDVRRQDDVAALDDDRVAVLADFHRERLVHDVGHGTRRDEVSALVGLRPDTGGVDAAVGDRLDLDAPALDGGEHCAIRAGLGIAHVEA